MAKIPFKCTNCGNNYSCDTEDNGGEAFRSTGQTVIIERCPICGHRNRIVFSFSEG